ncbi:unnamed protein product [Didymodactylos carnosus]|uniref:RRM domain-containing protein n=1 Tax=Didymodactylos carnosus TaxID=1234261 RepID=A0A815DA17_9BILA|nr:unnamed protein product [Didymodactylos carnosus]CAF1293562.1 unnamed protein product [Didymodactylos carnosus]CAF3950301.1 unnamed protein product [Didymodactylos carnosus]CAF4103624.1 unnamed protein product [Didymodactylos carnosus]
MAAASSNNGDKLSLGLDDIIRLDRTTGPRRRGGAGGGSRGFRGGFRGRGGFNRGSFNGFRRGSGTQRPSGTPQGRWQHDLYEENQSFNKVRPQRQTGGANTTAKLLISNLDYGVTTNDIQELFEDVGPIRTARVHYDKSGRSLGTAEVVFERRPDAITAQQKYNTLNLDGRPMDIRLVRFEDNLNLQSQQTRNSSYNDGNDSTQSYRRGGDGNRTGNAGNSNGYGRVMRRTNMQNGGGRGRGRQQNGGAQRNNNNNDQSSAVTVEDLDADLDAYRQENKKK